MTTIPLPSSSSPGFLPHESGGRLINSYWVPLSDTARGQRSYRRAPGLRPWATSGQSGPRGSLLVGSTLYSAFSGNVTTFASDGTPTSVGALGGTKKVFWARNLKAPTPDVLVVDPDNGASLVTSSSVTAYNADGILPAVNSVSFLDGYFFLTTGDGRCFATDLNATTVDAETFITCEGKPDGLLRAISFTDLYLAGQDSIEVWHDTAEVAPAFPFSRLVVIPKGLIGRYAISGFENGSDKGIIFVSGDHKVYALNGYSPVEISTPDVVRAIRSFIDGGGDADDIEMFPHVVGATSVVMRSPAWTWVFNVDNPSWHERASHLSPTWRATGSVNAFGKWITGDETTGNLVEISEDARDELGDPMTWTVESGPVTGFPNRMAVMQATFDMAQGVGIATGVDPTQTDPTVAVSYSDDGGTTWSAPRLRKLKRQAQRPHPIKVVKCGSSSVIGRRWRLQVSDAVDVALTGGDQSQELRAD
jgi:hypothetical protein